MDFGPGTGYDPTKTRFRIRNFEPGFGRIKKRFMMGGEESVYMITLLFSFVSNLFFNF